jgi:hypothetical protein
MGKGEHWEKNNKRDIEKGKQRGKMGIIGKTKGMLRRKGEKWERNGKGIANLPP